MIIRTKKEKGDIGLTKVIANLTENNVFVSIPISEHLKYDLVVEKDGVLLRVQVRYTSKNKKGTLSVKLRSVWSNRAGVHVKKRVKGDFDVLPVYCPDNQGVYYIHDSDFDCKSAICLRLEPSIVNDNRTRYASNYKNFSDACKVHTNNKKNLLDVPEIMEK